MIMYYSYVLFHHKADPSLYSDMQFLVIPLTHTSSDTNQCEEPHKFQFSTIAQLVI